MSNSIHLPNLGRMELERYAASRTGREQDARRAQPILLLAGGDICD